MAKANLITHFQKLLLQFITEQDPLLVMLQRLVEQLMQVGLEDVIARVPYFIQEVYNTRRLHSSIGYVSPEEFEASIVCFKEPDVQSEILSAITS